MAAPKRKTSRSNTRHRRAQWKAVAPDLVPIIINGVQRGGAVGGTRTPRDTDDNTLAYLRK